MGYVEEGFQLTPARSAIDFLKAVKRFEKKYCPLYHEQYQTDVATIYVEGGLNFEPINAFRESVHKYFRNLIIVSIPESLHLPIAEQPDLFSARASPAPAFSYTLMTCHPDVLPKRTDMVR
jgi:hypothetical protein